MPSAVVVGAGIFGAALADRLVAEGWEVTLVDSLAPGDPRSESGGETRMLRFSHGADPLYTELAYRARSLWRELGENTLLETGVVWFVRSEGGWEEESAQAMGAAGIPTQRLDPDTAATLFPSLETSDLTWALLEPEAGVLRAGHGVRALVARARSRGLRLERAVAAPARAAVALTYEDGGRPRTLEADHVVWACGAWLGRLFPGLVSLRVTRQDVALFDAPPEWVSPGVPGWLDFSQSFYGHGLVEPHGFKVSCDAEGAEIDPDARPERAEEGYVERSRRYLAHRFPALAGTTLRSAPVCHYSLTRDGGFLFDRHPEHDDVWLLGGGSGHGYKHGPAIAEQVAAVLRAEAQPEPRFALGEREHSTALRTAGS